MLVCNVLGHTRHRVEHPSVVVHVQIPALPPRRHPSMMPGPARQCGRTVRGCLLCPQHSQAADVVEVMQRIVQRVFEQPPNRYPFVADRDPSAPVRCARPVGARSEPAGLATQIRDDGVGIFVVVCLGTRLISASVPIAGYAGSSSASACSTPKTCSAVMSRLCVGVFDRRPRLRSWPHSQLGALLDEYLTPLRSQLDDRLGQRRVVVDGAVEPARRTAFVISITHALRMPVDERLCEYRSRQGSSGARHDRQRRGAVVGAIGAGEQRRARQPAVDRGRARRPSAIAQTIRLWPRPMSPQTNTPSTIVRQSASRATLPRPSSQTPSCSTSPASGVDEAHREEHQLARSSNSVPATAANGAAVDDGRLDLDARAMPAGCRRRRRRKHSSVDRIDLLDTLFVRRRGAVDQRVRGPGLTSVCRRGGRAGSRTGARSPRPDGSRCRGSRRRCRRRR